MGANPDLRLYRCGGTGLKLCSTMCGWRHRTSSENWEGAEVPLWSAVGVVVVSAAWFQVAAVVTILSMSLAVAALWSGAEIRIVQLGANAVVGPAKPVGARGAVAAPQTR